jgi:hypothetical protein
MLVFMDVAVAAASENDAASDMNWPVVQGRALMRKGRVPVLNHRTGDRSLM